LSLHGDAHQAVRILVRKRVQYDRVDHRIHRGAPPDTQRQRPDRDRSESPNLRETSHPKPQIANELSDPSKSVHMFSSLSSLRVLCVLRVSALNRGSAVLLIYPRTNNETDYRQTPCSSSLP